MSVDVPAACRFSATRSASSAPQQLELLPRSPAARRRARPRALRRRRRRSCAAVPARGRRPAPGGIDRRRAALERASRRELAIVRRRVILADDRRAGPRLPWPASRIARVLGGRIRRLAGTAATLAARRPRRRARPRPGSRPQELVTLGESLNGMAARLAVAGGRDHQRARPRPGAHRLAGRGRARGRPGRRGDGRQRRRPSASSGSPRAPSRPASTRCRPPILDAVLAARRADGAAGRPPPGGRCPAASSSSCTSRPLADDRRRRDVLTLRDVTEERRLERARRDLVANVSHELKTPIAALKGFLELLEGDAVSERHRREFLASMTQETAPPGAAGGGAAPARPPRRRARCPWSARRSTWPSSRRDRPAPRVPAGASATG